MEAKYDSIGIDYNHTRKADSYLSKRLLYHLNPNSNGIFLDIGCGTGNYTIALKKSGIQFIGIDPSRRMLDIAHSKSQNIDWRMGTAENTGLPGQSIDGIIATLTIHHWSDLQAGFSELFRVLKENGHIVIFTSTPEQMKKYWLNHYFPKMLSDSIDQMPSFEEVNDAMLGAGFNIIQTEKYAIREDLEDKFLYCGKHNPRLYFDKHIRKGISSFSNLANQEEVEQGLKEMKKDLESGKIDHIIRSYKNTLGDYLYIVGKKSRKNDKDKILNQE